MKYEVDSYTLEYIENEEKYYISFNDSVGKECRLEIDKDIFDIYLKSKKAYIKIKNETSRYLEHSELDEEQLYKRIFKQPESVENIIIKDNDNNKLNKALSTLTETQLRRVELHIINAITIRDLAKREKARKKQIEKSIYLGLKKIKKFFEN